MSKVLALVVALVMSLSGAAASTAGADEPQPEWGSVSVADAKLKRGCRDYTYSYAVTAPDEGEWALEVSVVEPGGETAWFGYVYEGANPDAGTATFRLCRTRSEPGRYKLRAVVSLQTSNEETRGALPTAKFRLR